MKQDKKILCPVAKQQFVFTICGFCACICTILLIYETLVSAPFFFYVGTMMSGPEICTPTGCSFPLHSSVFRTDAKIFVSNVLADVTITKINDT